MCKKCHSCLLPKKYLKKKSPPEAYRIFMSKYATHPFLVHMECNNQPADYLVPVYKICKSHSMDRTSNGNTYSYLKIRYFILAV